MDFLAQELAVDKKLLLKMNPDYDLFVLKKYGTNNYNLHLPKDKLDVFIQKKPGLQKRSKAYYAQNQI
jgi:hypothetical protein